MPYDVFLPNIGRLCRGMGDIVAGIDVTLFPEVTTVFDVRLLPKCGSGVESFCLIVRSSEMLCPKLSCP